MLPPRSGVTLPDGRDAITEATVESLVAWLRARGVPEPRLAEVTRLDRGFQGFRRAVLRYGLVKALIDKGYAVERDEAAWKAYDAAMRAELGEPPA